MISPDAKAIVEAIKALTKEIQELRRDVQKSGR